MIVSFTKSYPMTLPDGVPVSWGVVLDQEMLFIEFNGNKKPLIVIGHQYNVPFADNRSLTARAVRIVPNAVQKTWLVTFEPAK